LKHYHSIHYYNVDYFKCQNKLNSSLSFLFGQWYFSGFRCVANILATTSPYCATIITDEGDIFDSLQHHFLYFEYVVYTNSDIILHEDFYNIVLSKILDEGFDAFSVNRQTISKYKNDEHLYTSNDLHSIFELEGEEHPGFDCFIMTKGILSNIELGNIIIGFPPIGQILELEIESNAKKFRNFSSLDLRATYHLGDDRSWNTETTSSYGYTHTNMEIVVNNLFGKIKGACQARVNNSRDNLRLCWKLGRWLNKFKFTAAAHDIGFGS